MPGRVDKKPTSKTSIKGNKIANGENSDGNKNANGKSVDYTGTPNKDSYKVEHSFFVDNTCEKKMAKSEVNKCMEWLFDKQGEMESAGFGRGKAGVSEALVEQHAKTKDLLRFQGQVDHALQMEGVDGEAAMALNNRLHSVQALSSRRGSCLDVLGQITQLEDLVGNLSTEFDSRALSLSDDCKNDSAVHLVNSRPDATVGPDQTNESMARTAQTMISSMRHNWRWVFTTMQCAEVHLRNAAAYHQFFQEEQEARAWMSVTLQRIHASFSDTQSGQLGDARRLLEEMRDVLAAYLHWQTKIDYLYDRAREVVPVPLRVKGVKEPRPAIALADYSSAELGLREGEAVTLTSGGDGAWRVRTQAGEEGGVPSVILLLPPPCGEALDAATRLKLQLLALWTNSVKRLGNQMLAFMLLVFKDWSDEEIAQLQAMTVADRARLLRILLFMEEELLVLWAGHKDSEELQERLLRLRMILEEATGDSDGENQFTSTLIVQMQTLEDLMRKYKDFWTFWETYKCTTESMRSPRFMLVCDKWEQLRFVTSAHYVKFWDTSLDMRPPGGAHLAKANKGSLVMQEAPSAPLGGVEDMIDASSTTTLHAQRQVSSAVTVEERKEESTQEQVTGSLVEEETTFIIKGILDPRDDATVLTLEEAVRAGIINQENKTYVNPKTKAVISMSDATNEGRIMMELVARKKIREEKNTYGLITLKITKETRPYTITGVLDPKTDEKLSVAEAAARGVYDDRAQTYRDIWHFDFGPSFKASNINDRNTVFQEAEHSELKTESTDLNEKRVSDESKFDRSRNESSVFDDTEATDLTSEDIDRSTLNFRNFSNSSMEEHDELYISHTDVFVGNRRLHSHTDTLIVEYLENTILPSSDEEGDEKNLVDEGDANKNSTSAENNAAGVSNNANETEVIEVIEDINDILEDVDTAIDTIDSRAADDSDGTINTVIADLDNIIQYSEGTLVKVKEYLDKKDSEEICYDDKETKDVKTKFDTQNQEENLKQNEANSTPVGTDNLCTDDNKLYIFMEETTYSVEDEYHNDDMEIYTGETHSLPEGESKQSNKAQNISEKINSSEGTDELRGVSDNGASKTDSKSGEHEEKTDTLDYSITCDTSVLADDHDDDLDDEHEDVDGDDDHEGYDEEDGEDLPIPIAQSTYLEDIQEDEEENTMQQSSPDSIKAGNLKHLNAILEEEDNDDRSKQNLITALEIPDNETDDDELPLPIAQSTYRGNNEGDEEDPFNTSSEVSNVDADKNDSDNTIPLKLQVDQENDKAYLTVNPKNTSFDENHDNEGENKQDAETEILDSEGDAAEDALDMLDSVLDGEMCISDDDIEDNDCDASEEDNDESDEAVLSDGGEFNQESDNRNNANFTNIKDARTSGLRAADISFDDDFSSRIVVGAEDEESDALDFSKRIVTGENKEAESEESVNLSLTPEPVDEDSDSVITKPDGIENTGANKVDRESIVVKDVPNKDAVEIVETMYEEETIALEANIEYPPVEDSKVNAGLGSGFQEEHVFKESRRPLPLTRYLRRALYVGGPLAVLYWLMFWFVLWVPVCEDDRWCMTHNNLRYALASMLRYTDGPPPT